MAAQARILPTSPRTWKDKYLWPLLLVTWDRWVQKSSHWWHWQDFRQWKGYNWYHVHVPGSPKAKERRSLGWLTILKRTDFEWEDAVILQPTRHRESYHLGFRATEGGKVIVQKCTVLLVGPVAALQGASTTEFFATTKEGIPVELEIIGYTTKARLDAVIPLV